MKAYSDSTGYPEEEEEGGGGPGGATAPAYSSTPTPYQSAQSAPPAQPAGGPTSYGASSTMPSSTMPTADPNVGTRYGTDAQAPPTPTPYAPSAPSAITPYSPNGTNIDPSVPNAPQLPQKPSPITPYSPNGGPTDTGGMIPAGGGRQLPQVGTEAPPGATTANATAPPSQSPILAAMQNDPQFFDEGHPGYNPGTRTNPNAPILQMPGVVDPVQALSTAALAGQKAAGQAVGGTTGRSSNDSDIHQAMAPIYTALGTAAGVGVDQQGRAMASVPQPDGGGTLQYTMRPDGGWSPDEGSPEITTQQLHDMIAGTSYSGVQAQNPSSAIIAGLGPTGNQPGAGGYVDALGKPITSGTAPTPIAPFTGDQTQVSYDGKTAGPPPPLPQSAIAAPVLPPPAGPPAPPPPPQYTPPPVVPVNTPTTGVRTPSGPTDTGPGGMLPPTPAKIQPQAPPQAPPPPAVGGSAPGTGAAGASAGTQGTAQVGGNNLLQDWQSQLANLSKGNLAGANGVDTNAILQQLLSGGSALQGPNAQTQGAINNLLQNPSAFNSDAVKATYNDLGGQIDDEYALQQKQLETNMAARGLSDSSIRGGKLADLNVGKRSAKEQLASSLATQQAQSLSQAQQAAINLGLSGSGQQQTASAQNFAQQLQGLGFNQNNANTNTQMQGNILQQILGYGQQGFNNDVTTQQLNQQQQQEQDQLYLQLLGLA